MRIHIGFDLLGIRLMARTFGLSIVRFDRDIGSYPWHLLRINISDIDVHKSPSQRNWYIEIELFGKRFRKDFR
jgi:hypothetical protein